MPSSVDCVIESTRGDTWCSSRRPASAERSCSGRTRAVGGVEQDQLAAEMALGSAGLVVGDVRRGGAHDGLVAAEHQLQGRDVGTGPVEHREHSGVLAELVAEQRLGPRGHLVVAVGRRVVDVRCADRGDDLRVDTGVVVAGERPHRSPSWDEDDLPHDVAGHHGGHGVGGLLERAGPGRSPGVHRTTSSSEIRLASSPIVPIVEPTTSSCRKNMRERSAEGTDPLVAPLMTMRPPGPERAHRVRPRGFAHRLDHRVDAVRQPGAGFERRVRAERLGERPLGLGAPGAPHAEAHRARQDDGGGGDPAGGALHEHRLTGAQPRAGGEHAVRGEPGDGQAGRFLERQRRRLGQQVAGGNHQVLGERAVVHLGEQRARGVERLVATTGDGVADHPVHDDLATGVVDAGGVAARG